MKKLLLLLFWFLSSLGHLLSETFYVRPEGTTYGSGNGSSWANAWSGFSSVAWGSGAGQVGAGDTLYVGTGTYNQQLVVPTVASGTSNTNRTTIRAAQDTQTGPVTFTAADTPNPPNDPICAVRLESGGSGTNWITLDGLFGSAQQFRKPTGRISLQFGCIGVVFKGWIISNGLILAEGQGQYEFAYNTITIPNGGGDNFAIGLTGTTDQGQNVYGRSSIHHNTITIPCNIQNGHGPDGLQQPACTDIYNNVLQVVFNGGTASLEHQDVIQQYGTDYNRIYNNAFIDSGEAMVGMDRVAGVMGAMAHIWIYNNTFVRTIADTGVTMIRIYNAGTTASDVHIDNNTFIDAANNANYGAAISLNSTNGVVSTTNCSIQNNIFFNCGMGWPVILIQNVPQAGWTVTNNLVNAGTATPPLGNTNLSGWTNTSGQSGVPGFVSYTQFSLSNNMHLSSSDTAATGHGADLSARFTTDKDGFPRTVPWSIGAYISSANQVVAPTFTPGEGPFFGTQSIDAASPTSGAVIHFTNDGSTPTSGSPTWSVQSVSTGTTLKAMATKAGMTDSGVVTAFYEIGTWTTAGLHLWKTFAVPAQSGTFQWAFRVVVTSATSDTVIGLASTAVGAFSDLGPIIRFNGSDNPGFIDARDGAGYNHVNSIPYGVGTNFYDIVCTVNKVARTYSATVSSNGGAPVALATNYAFRTDQNNPTGNLAFFGMLTDVAGTATVSNMTLGAAGDVTAPTPNPMTFSAVPSAIDTTSVTMTASLATDNLGGAVEYQFTETTGHSGGTTSGWQSSRTYVDSGLTPNTLYTYTVAARDSSGNQTAASAPGSVTTTAAATPGSANCNTTNVTNLRIGP